MGKLSILKLMLKDLPNTRELMAASREYRGLTVYKLAEALGPEAKKPWHEWGDKEFAHFVYSLLVDFKVAEWNPDGSITLYKMEPPRITNPKVAEWKTIMDRVFPRLIDALEGNRKYFLDRELLLSYAKFLDNIGYNWWRELAIRVIVPEQDRQNPNLTFVDIGSGIGLSTLAILKLTNASIIAVDPYDDNLEMLRHYVAMSGYKDRVKTFKGYAENFRLDQPVDGAFLINILHWSDVPSEVIKNATRNVKQGGRVYIFQGVLEDKTLRLSFLIPYLLGAPRIGIRRRELYQWIKDAGLQVEHSESIAGELIRARAP
ncbi:class I SAM-dependent methyltransferase [Thermofilum sp.]|jgi:ubiquinone/menaquinone biosynthesis C-methylase UbiE|uniref:class I SAM-dependent methyltransferase n=1 Tax=Thermofilum sp. TaxID=1961369 RepID=UPI00258A44AF|nr:class I SAM-dependent methyltransferase [Thermofilum sp.]